MTTVEYLRDAVTRPAATVSIAGVPWPAWKVLALVVGFLAFGLTAVVTASAGPAVLTGSGVAALMWLGFGFASRTHNR